MKQIVIYGAQSMALGVHKAIKVLFPEREILCYVVTKPEENESCLNGLLVEDISSFSSKMDTEEKNEIEVWIAVPENVMGEIEETLEKEGFYHRVCITSLRWAEMMKEFFIKKKEFSPLVLYPDGTNKAKLQIYKMVHDLDKRLKTEYKDTEYVKTVQVGTVFSERKEADFYDDEGDSISDKNKNYCELTGLYWIWKNQVLQDMNYTNKYYGLSHYRRFLDFSDKDVWKLQENDIDVVLPYPMPYEPDIAQHHKRYLNDQEWNAVVTAMQELYPEYVEAMHSILKQEYFYNYNIIAAKGKVLNEYCSWLFPLLFRIEELNDPKKEKMPNRYMGYIGETLETIYFMYHKRHLKIAHTGCRFLI